MFFICYSLAKKRFMEYIIKIVEYLNFVQT